MTDKKVISIGILKSDKNSIILYILKEIFVNCGYKLVNYSNNAFTMLTKENKLLLIAELHLENLESIVKLDFCFDIIIHTSLNENEYDNPSLKKIINKSRYIIMNIDEKNSKKLLNKHVKGLIITYGINKKATITTSSFVISNAIQFNLCLQRKILDINGKIIEPMDIPISLNLIGKRNIYYGLAVIACGLVYGKNIEEIKKNLTGVTGAYRYLEKIYDKEYMIIDSNCNIPNDYNLVFEEIQNLKYKDIYILNGIEIDQGIYTIKNNLKTILNWKPILNIKKIFLYLDLKDTLIKRNINLMLLNYNIDYEIFSSLDECIYHAIQELSKNDLLMVLGNESLEYSREFINQLIK